MNSSEQATVSENERRALKKEEVQAQMKKKLDNGINSLKKKIVSSDDALKTEKVKDFFSNTQKLALDEGIFYEYLKTEGFITEKTEAEMGDKTMEEFIAALEEARDLLGAPYEVKSNKAGKGNVSLSGARQAISGKVVAVLDESGNEELSPEQKQERWLGAFAVRFNKLSVLHEGINYTDVEKSLKRDPEAIRRLMILDENGHDMNVFGYDEKTKEFIFASAWNNYKSVAADHRNIAYDPVGQKLTEDNGNLPNGNAISIIAKIMGCEEKDASKYLASEELHNQLRAAIENNISGWAWLQTDAATRKTGFAFCGSYNGVDPYIALNYHARGSFRAALRVKKV